MQPFACYFSRILLALCCVVNGALDSVLNGATVMPNVLIVLTDDQGFGDVGSHGNPWVDTPHHDRLAASGVRFERFYVSPVCAPTRASLLTGRWHLRTGVHGVTRGYETMSSHERTIAEIFQDAGYATAAFGKWHNGAHYPEHPLGQGFDRFYGFCGGHFNNYFDSTLENNQRREPFDGYIIDRLTDRAIQFMEADREQPWFCYVAYNTPHSPWQVPEKYWQRFAELRDLPDDKARCAYAMVENIDDNLGRLQAAIRRLGVEQHTIVVFLTDNGANSDRFNAGMRGRKGSVHEGGTRVPCFLSWPGRLAAGQRIQQIAAHVDLLPTLCRLAGVHLPRNLPLDGMNLEPLLTLHGNPPPDDVLRDWPDRKLYTHWGNDDRGTPRTDRGAVRTNRWRAVLERERWQLYDMGADPGETHDVADQHPDVLLRLSKAYARWFAEVTAVGFSSLPIQVGHDRAPTVQLPGHEAALHPAQDQGIRYHGRRGWANDWITGWTEPTACATWELDVVRAGRYRVTLHYAATPEQAARNSVEVVVGRQRLTCPIGKAHAGPVVDSPDRVPRNEVYEREWGKLEVGILNLPVGRAQLAVCPSPQETAEFLDLKAVTLQRVPASP